MSLGTLNESIVHPRDVFRPAIALNAYAIVLMHNHPSGDPMPSEPDRSITAEISDGAALLRIKFLDHVIVAGGTKYFSFKEAGALQNPWRRGKKTKTKAKKSDRKRETLSNVQAILALGKRSPLRRNTQAFWKS
ncbi:MAG: JAB domain-containing protein [Chthoniobacterales bacterium]